MATGKPNPKIPQTLTLPTAIHKIQLSLIQTPSTPLHHILSAAAFLSKPDYDDVVTERNLSDLCGYPLCPNPNPNPNINPYVDSTNRKKNRKYRIVLSEHKVYDLQESYKYCKEECLIGSRAFREGLDEERRAGIDVSRRKVEEVLRMFGYFDGGKDNERKREVNKKLEIKEREEVVVSDLMMDDVMANAIEGYVPQFDRGSKFASNLESEQETDGAKSSKTEVVYTVSTGDKINGALLKKSSLSTNDASDMITNMLEDMAITEKERSNRSHSRPCKSKPPKEAISNNAQIVDNGDMGFTSSIILGNELDAMLPKTCDVSELIAKQLEDVIVAEKTLAEAKSSKLPRSKSRKKASNINRWNEKTKSQCIMINENSIDGAATSSMSKESKHDVHAENFSNSASVNLENNEVLQKNSLKPSLKTSGSKGRNQSVKWADEKNKGALHDNNNLPQTAEVEDSDLRVASAEACAAALSQAAEAVASGQAETLDAVSEAGIVIFPQPQEVENGEFDFNEAAFELEHGVLKWPKKTVLLDTDMFEVEDSLHDTAPEGFNLTLSTFARMWMALFGWITCSSVAYIYGHDDSLHEDFLLVNGREYPRKIILSDGKSSEIMVALDGFICRALHGLIMDLKLPIPVSTMEKHVACLLDTMSFVDALPSFRMKQWQAIVYLFIEALSVKRLPFLASHLTRKNMLVYKVLNGAKVSNEEFETMRDLIMPLGRLPQ